MKKKKAAFFVWAILLAILMVSFNETEAGVTRPDAAGIDNIQWFLAEVNGNPVSRLAGERRPFIKFDAVKKQATGFSGCNNFFGGYECDGASLKFGPVGATRMACPDLEMSLETEVFKALDQTRAWKIQGKELLLLDDSEILARFTEENIQGITGTVWQWVQTQYNDDTKAVPADPQNYTVQFREDETLNVRADCNQKGGAYSASTEEGRISIEITHSTMADCPEGSLEDEFVRELTAAAIYFIKDGDLYIDLKYDSGTMRFSKQEVQ